MFPSHLIIHPCCYIILLSFSNAWYRLLLRPSVQLKSSFPDCGSSRGGGGGGGGGCGCGGSRSGGRGVGGDTQVYPAAHLFVIIWTHLRYNRNHIEFGLEKEGLSG